MSDTHTHTHTHRQPCALETRHAAPRGSMLTKDMSNDQGMCVCVCVCPLCRPNNLALLTKRASLALSSVAGDMLDQLSMVDRSSANTARSSQAGWALGSSRLSRLNRSSATSQYSSIDIAAYPSRQPSVAQYSTMSHSSVRRSVLEGQYAVAPGMDGE